MQSSYSSGRAAYNLNPGQIAPYDRNYALTGGERRYHDQTFDSQISRQSHDNSLNNDSSRIYDSNPNMKRSETDLRVFQEKTRASKQVHYNVNQTGKTNLGPLGTIDEDKMSANHQDATMKRQGAHNVNLDQSIGARSDLLGGSFKFNGDPRNDQLIQSLKIEESVKAMDRIPIRIEGLTPFLIDEHYRFTGVQSDNVKTLHQYWKSHISEAYRELMRNDKKVQLQETFDKSMQKSKKKENRSPPREPIERKEWTKFLAPKTIDTTNYGMLRADQSKSDKMEIVGRLYEMDVVHTLEKDYFERLDGLKSQQIGKEMQNKILREKYEINKEKESIHKAVNTFFDDLTQYETSKISTDIATQSTLLVKDSKSKANIGESLDLEKIEPQKPSISEEQKKKELEDKVKKIKDDRDFMAHLFEYSLIKDLSNDPVVLNQQYLQCDEKSRHNLIVKKSDEDVRKLIEDFFSPEKFIKRIILAQQCSHGTYKTMSLMGFYQQLSKREKLLNLIYKKEVKLQSEEEYKKYTKKQVIQQIYEKHTEVKDIIYKKSSVEKMVIVYEMMQKNETHIISSYQQEEENKRQMEINRKLKQQVFGKKKALEMEEKEQKYDPVQRIKELATPKDKWKKLKILKALRRQFPHDILIKKMVQHEEQHNRLFRYPQEYDLFDEEFEAKIKYLEKGGLEIKGLDGAHAKVMMEKFTTMDNMELRLLNEKLRQQRSLRQSFEEFIMTKVQEYLSMIKKRLLGQQQTLRTFVSAVYHEALLKHRRYTQLKFEYKAYGTKKTSETYKKSYPFEFKQYFFSMVKTYVRTSRGYKKAKRPIPTFILPGGLRCHVHKADCPEGCKLVTYNKKAQLRHTILRRKQRIPHAYRSRVWRRDDLKKSLKEVFLLDSELDNCTFEPEAGTMSKNINDMLKANPNLGNSEVIKDPEPDAFFIKLGKNFEKSHPEVYKAGVLKRARLKYSQGKYEEAMNTLSEGFNVASIRRHYDPVYREKWHKEQREKEKQQNLKAPGSTATSQTASTQKQAVSFMQQNRLQKEDPDEQKKRPEEDFESKKLESVLREAFDLIMILINRKLSAEKTIRQIKSSQTAIKKQMRSFSSFKRSMTRADPSKGEKILFKSIMCPLKDKCAKVQNHRWPTSNIKAVKQFGENCPFAHHPMELCFPESIITKLSSSYQTIKTITAKIDEEKSRAPFKPAGGLFDCVGCNNKSGKHMGGPCNLCRYKEMADEESKKYTDKHRKASLTRSIERRQTSVQREEKREMSQIRQAMDLDNNYTKKFGLFKKACILHFYGRYNDAFDEIAKAAKIIQDQNEIERQKQLVIEKRWRFKLGLDDGFELPLPIEQIDPTKVDDKFLKKMDLGGSIALSTLKLFIENVHPNKNEEYSKHAFLNQLIEDTFQQFEATIEDKMETIKKMKKQVERLDELADRLEGSPGSSPERLGTGKAGDLSKTQKNKRSKLCPHLVANRTCPQAKVPKCPYVHTPEEFIRLNKEAARESEKTGNERKHYQMCDKVLKNEKCPLVGQRACPYEHNPILFDLIPPENKIKNLNGVIQSSAQKLKHMKPLEPWRPAKSGDIEHTDLMDMSSKRRKKEGEEDEDEEHTKKKKTVKRSIFERENIFKKPYEAQE